MAEGEIFPQCITCQMDSGNPRYRFKQEALHTHTTESLLLLTGLVVDLESCVLLAGEYADNYRIVSVLDELLHLFCCLDLLGGRTRLLDHVVNDTW